MNLKETIDGVPNVNDTVELIDLSIDDLAGDSHDDPVLDFFLCDLEVRSEGGVRDELTRLSEVWNWLHSHGL